MRNLREIWEKAYNTYRSRSAGRYKSRVYGDIPSFMEFPVAWNPEDLEGTDAVVIGIPWEGLRQLDSDSFAPMGGRPADPEAVINRSGAYDSPAYVRTYSIQYSTQMSAGYLPQVGQDFYLCDQIAVKDYRDVKIEMWDVEETAKLAVDRISDIVRAGAIPIILGGDHTISYMGVRAISDNSNGQMGIIVLDSDHDFEYSERLTCGSMWARVLETCNVDPKNVVMIGLRGSVNSREGVEVAKELGLTLIPITEVEEKGMDEVIRRAVDIATDGTERIYLSLDVDVIDPAFFPAQKWPFPLGLTSYQVRDALKTIARETNLAGFDIACIGPAYDYKGVGGITASRFILEVLIGIALRKGTKEY
jgi:arginase family enzyme